MAYAAAVMILGLTACGSPSDESSSPTTAATVTSVAGSPPVIQIAGGGATGEGRSAAPMAASEAADSKFAAYINYVYGGDLVDLTAPAASWYFEPGVEPSTDQIAALAAALGVEGDVRELAADMGSGWMVGPDSYEEPTLNVGADAMQSWWYNPGSTAVAAPYTDCELYPPGDPMGDTAAAAESGATGDTTAIDTAAPMPECEPTPPPANVPDEATAEQKARELFGSVGIDLDSYELETHADEWGANVTGYLVLEGIRTNVTISVGFGAEGAVTWANGYLATPQRGADYPRIGIEAAVQRLNDQSSSWMGLDTGVAARTDIAVDAVAETAESEPAVAPDATTMPAPADTMVDPIEGACLDDTGSECAPTSIEVEPITVTLTAARPSLEQLWGSDDTVWLLPGYAFDSSDGGIYSVLAVEDQYIQVVQVDPVPVDAPLPADSTATDPVPASTPTTMLLPGWESAAPLVGLAEAEAAKVAEGNGWTMRVVRIDGVDQAVTDDFSESRVNVAVENGTVTEIVSFG